jgi:alkylhydroperoxidase/carboxymuconolactone decarboxylase family protein YurZ
MTTMSRFEELMGELAADGGPLFQALARMNTGLPTSGDLDERTAVLMRFAALVALDAPPASYVVTLAVAQELGITPEMIQAGLIGLAPVVGGPRIVAAAAAVQQAVQ